MTFSSGFQVPGAFDSSAHPPASLPTMTSSLRRPRFGSAGTGGVASYVLQCRRVAQQQADANVEVDVDVDEPNAEKAVCHSIGTSIHAKKSAAHHGSNDSNQTMDQCIDLLGDHLKTFRDMCLRADALAAESSGEGAAAAAAASAAASKAQPDEIPPQLLRVVRFFRHKWPPLKRALLRPPEPQPRAQQQGGDGKFSGAAIIEVGSPALRLRLARALHARGMLSLAEVDELAAALERQQQEQFSEEAEGVVDIIDGDASPTKKRKLDRDDDMLAARLRLALSRLPSDAGPVLPQHGGSGGIGGNTSASSIEKARKGMRYARAVLSEWESRWNNITDGGSVVDSSACPSPRDVADWALTAFTGIVLANGIDYRPGRTGGVGGGVKFQPDDSNLEQSLGALLLPPTSRADSKSVSPLAQAVRVKIETYLAPSMVNDLTDVHLLSLSRLFAYTCYEEVVRNILVKSIVDCSKRSGGVGLQQLAKLLASYIALVESDKLSIEGLEATLKEMILEKHDENKVDSAAAAAAAAAAGAFAAGKDDGKQKRMTRALCFLDAIIQTAKFLRL